jgi:hypothetical protein
VSVSFFSVQRVVQIKSDTQGRFAFDRLKPGRYRLEAEVRGAETKVIDPQSAEGGESAADHSVAMD